MASFTDDTGGLESVVSAPTNPIEPLPLEFPVCERTPQVRDKLVSETGVDDCSDVTVPLLNAVTSLDPNGQGIAALKEGDFANLTQLDLLVLRDNGLSALPAGIFSGLGDLRVLRPNRNGLSTLPAGLFSGLSDLGQLFLDNNPGTNFSLRPELMRTDVAVTRPGAARVKVVLAQDAPFPMDIGLSASGATLPSPARAWGGARWRRRKSR